MSRFLRWMHSQNDEDDSLKQDAKVSELRASLGPLSGRTLKYCTDSCLRRYLEARSWNVDKAKKMLEETIHWRATYKPEEIQWHEVSHEGETGKAFRANFRDLQGIPVLISRPGMQNTNSSEGHIRHLVYLLENSCLNIPNGHEKMSWLIDFTGFSLSTKISLSTALNITRILQNYYPERLAIMFLYNPPRIFEPFYKALKYFIDPKTIQKIKFVYPNNKNSVELMKSFFDVDNLPCEFGGKATLKYDHEEFSKLMVQDDLRTAKFWTSYDKSSDITSENAGVDEGPESHTLAPPAS